jgi:glycosyltransferase involved in cell wall biosynthesis
MFLDGFAASDDPQLLSNLDSAQLIVAASLWLTELARARGVPTVHFPLALDQELFVPGPPNFERRLLVTASAQVAPRWGSDVLSDALVLVRETRPEVEATTFGGVPVDGTTRFFRHPPVAVAAEAMRESAVHVTSSREEGFNYLGAAALACGAALVTTDTHGSRDFAVHDRTAVLVPPEDAEALAGQVLSLLDDPDRRAGLAADGGRHVRSIMQTWPEAARKIAAIVAERF